MNVFILSHFQSPDYLADMIMLDLIGIDGINIFTNKIPEYLFDDYLEKDNLYGKGFTLYCKVPAVDKAKINLIASCRNEPDLIIYASVRRYFDSNFLNEYIGTCPIHVVDGEDDQHIAQPLLKEGITYHKRELIKNSNPYIVPISFKIPKVIQNLTSFDQQNKKLFLAGIHPSLRVTYTFSDEASYYSHYSSSLFAITGRKAGWDCLRHYEIIMSGCVPVFLEIDSKPNLTMQRWPRKLQLAANSIFLRLLEMTVTSEIPREYHIFMDDFHKFGKEQGETSYIETNFF